MFLTLVNASVEPQLISCSGLIPIFTVGFGKGVVSSCSLAPVPSACVGMLPMEVIEDVTVGWPMSMTFELDSVFLEGEVIFETASLDVGDDDGVRRMNFVT